MLVDGIMGNLDGLFNNVNEQVGEIAVQVGTTPADWNAGVFSMIRQLSETVVLLIAGIMANKTVISDQVCPHCSGKAPVIWDGNRNETCMYCKKRFRVQRKKLRNTIRINARRRERRSPD